MGEMGHTTKVMLVESIAVVVVLLFLVLFRPFIIGSLVTAQQPYTYSYTNATGPQTGTITPSGGLTAQQADSLFTIIIVVVVLAGLALIVFTAMGKLNF